MGERAGGGSGMGSGTRSGDASMRHLSAKAQKVLKAEEEAIRDAKVEHGLVMDINGNIVWKGTQNKKNTVSLGGNLENNITLHNHPQDSRKTISFSKTDLLNDARANVAEGRVVSGNYTYSIKRPKEGWRKGGWVGDKFYSNNAYAYKKAKATVDKRIKEYYKATAGSKASYPRVSATYWHLVTKEYAKIQGYQYTKTKVK